MLYTFYHVPGKKVGCTIDIWERTRKYKDPVEVLISIEFATDIEAGDYEWALADMYGYPRNQHYAKASWKSITPEQRQQGGVAGGRGRTASLTVEQLADISRKGGREAGKRGTSGFQTGAAARASVASPNHTTNKTVTCPSCGATGLALIMSRWHFARCPKRVRRPK